MALSLNRLLRPRRYERKIGVQVEFVLDYRSPYRYLANTRVKRLGAQTVYTPVDIVSVMKKVNNQPSTMCPPKAKYAGVDAARWARHYDVPFSPNGGVLEALKQGHWTKRCFRGSESWRRCLREFHADRSGRSRAQLPDQRHGISASSPTSRTRNDPSRHWRHRCYR